MRIKYEDFSTAGSTIKKKGFSYLIPDATLGKDFHWLARWLMKSRTSLSPARSLESWHLTADFHISLLNNVIELGLPQKALWVT